jgi:hypothetical protein
MSKTRTDYGKVLIVAPSGYGKSFTAKTADFEKTGLVNVENKPLSFKGTFKYHGKPKTWNGVMKNLEDYANNADINNLFLDSQSMAFDMLHTEMQNNFKGFDVYSNYNKQLVRYFDAIRNVNKDMIVLSHDETIAVEGLKQKRAKVQGKQFEGRVEAYYTVVLFADKRMKDGKPEYFLRTFAEDTSSKVPEGLFPDKNGDNLLEIPNSAEYIFKCLEEYYSA